MMNEERLLFWELVKSLKKPENLKQTGVFQQERYELMDIKLIVTDSGFTNKIVAGSVTAVDTVQVSSCAPAMLKSLKSWLGKYPPKR